jgi:ABC-type branched-subunit amino acid transport system substrate-binding protein
MIVGLLAPATGPAGLWAMPSLMGATLAAAAVNGRGGVLGAPMVLEFANAGASPAEAARAARALVADRRVDAIVAMQPSDQRAAVRAAIGGAVPYIYVSQFEGGYCGPRVIATGLTDAEALDPAVRWLAAARRARRFFFVGNDYVWPRAAFGVVGAAVRAAGGSMVGEATVAFGEHDHTACLAAIAAARPDVVVTVLLGEEAARFHRAFAEAGLARRMLRLGLGIDETVLLAIGAGNAENLFATSDFFRGADDPDAAAFDDAYGRAFGRLAPPPSCIARICHDGVRVAAALAAAAGLAEGRALAARLPTRVDRLATARLIGDEARGLRRPVRVAAADGLDFRVVATG